ncbi:MAG: diguanylate cyclase (GGDEF)-like protein [Flavobacteriales bacterium]|jgi:diguanylate cyclase (GGDEF)-like protein
MSYILNMLVKELMSPLSVFSQPDEAFTNAVLKMHSHKLSCLIVLNLGRIVGIFTERDAIRVFADHLGLNKDLDLSMAEVMTADPVCIESEASIGEAFSLTRARKIRHLPVVDGHGEVCGVITQAVTIEAFFKSQSRHDELAEANEILQSQALEDALLGIGNRRAMEVDLHSMCAEAKRYSKPFSVAMIDVDKFKLYNDHYGHQQGDEALKQICQIILTSMRDGDRLYRYGGEELLLLLNNTEQDLAAVAAERIRSAIVDSKIEHCKSDFGVVTVSMGLVAWRDSLSKTSLIELADAALYRAKAGGRNRLM